MRPQAILCATDFSAPSRPAFEAACDLARDSGGRLLLAHAYQPWIPPAPEMPIMPAEMIERGRGAVEEKLAALREEAIAGGVARVQAHFVVGPAWDRIVELARVERCDLIVIGTHGRTGLSHVLLGSVAEKVTRHAPCSVLVVR